MSDVDWLPPLDWPIARYRLESVLRPGHLMHYFRAADEETGAPVMVKAMKKSERGPRAAESFVAEGRAVSRLNHDGVLRVLDVGEGGDWIFHAYELDDNKRCVDVVEPGVAPMQAVLVVIEQAARTLAHLHARGLAHGTLQPESILVGPNLQAKLVNFNFGWEWSPGFVFEYAPPEHTERAYMKKGQTLKIDDQRADVYMLGGTLWTLLVGKPYMTAERNLAALSIFHAAPPPADPGVHRNDLPRWLRRLVERCLAPKPAHRYANADDVAVELEGRVEPPGLPSMTRALSPLSSSLRSKLARPLPAIVNDLAALRSPALAAFRLLDLAEATTKLLCTAALALNGATDAIPARPSLGHWCAALRANHGALPGGLSRATLRTIDEAVALRNAVRGHGALADEASYRALLEERAADIVGVLAQATALTSIDVGDAGFSIEGRGVDARGLIVVDACGVCGAREALVFNAGDEKKRSLLSYETGHITHR